MDDQLVCTIHPVLSHNAGIGRMDPTFPRELNARTSTGWLLSRRALSLSLCSSRGLENSSLRGLKV